MLSKKMFWAGQPGIRNLAKHIARYPSKFDEEKADALLMNVVRMQEIVGTGGSGFRTIYSDFLKESAAILNWGELEIFANRMLDISDDWRKFAIMATRSVKKRKDSQQDSFSKVSQYLYQIAEKEKQFFVDLNDLKIIQ